MPKKKTQAKISSDIALALLAEFLFSAFLIQKEYEARKFNKK